MNKHLRILAENFSNLSRVLEQEIEVIFGHIDLYR